MQTVRRMPARQDAPVVKFAVETVQVLDGKELKAIRPDEDGYFCDFPVAVIGAVSRNNTHYDSKSVEHQIVTPGQIMNMMLTDGTLYGEWGHPKLTTLKPDMMFLRRLTEIHEDRVSHHIRKIRVGDPLPGGGQILYADIKPFGPFKEQLFESLMDPKINTAFSLRSICSESIDRAASVIYRTVKRLVTFDAVCTGGFAEASKRFVSATEAIALDMAELMGFDGVQMPGEYATEMIKDKDILDIFDAKDMVVNKTTVGFIVPKTNCYIDESGNMQSIFHTFNKSRRIR